MRQSYTRGQTGSTQPAAAPRRRGGGGSIDQKGATCKRSFVICGAANAWTGAGAGKPTTWRHCVPGAGSVTSLTEGAAAGLVHVGEFVALYAVWPSPRIVSRRALPSVRTRFFAPRYGVAGSYVVPTTSGVTAEPGTLNGPSNASLSWTG